LSPKELLLPDALLVGSVGESQSDQNKVDLAALFKSLGTALSPLPAPQLAGAAICAALERVLILRAPGR